MGRPQSLTLMEEYQLPQASVLKAVKNGLPAGTVVSKEAKNAFSAAGTVSVFWLINSANDLCKEKHKSTVMPEHVIQAVSRDAGFVAQTVERFSEALKKEKELKKPVGNATQDDDEEDAVKAITNEESVQILPPQPDAEGQVELGEEEEPSAKRAKIEEEAPSEAIAQSTAQEALPTQEDAVPAE